MLIVPYTVCYIMKVAACHTYTKILSPWRAAKGYNFDSR